MGSRTRGPVTSGVTGPDDAQTGGRELRDLIQGGLLGPVGAFGGDITRRERHPVNDLVTGARG